MSIRKLCDCSRLATIVGLAIALMLAVGANVWGQPGQGQCCYPAPGQFRFPTDAIIQAQFGPTPVQLQLMGPTMVRTLTPDPVMNIPTEMLALELTGMNPMGGMVGLHLIPGTNSMGQTMGPQSFFDVFTELSLDNAPWGGGPDMVYVGLPNNQYIPVRVTNDALQCIPPQPGATWRTPPPPYQVPLTSRRLNQQVGVLTLVAHTVLEPNHYKTWRITDFSPPQIRTVIAKDQFMTDNLVLDNLVYLSNPVQKCIPGRCFNIADTADHFAWYNARGRDTLLDVEFENQFQRTTLRIDSVKYFLLPARKFPHNTPKLLDHYKAYKIRDPQPITLPVQLLDQFDLTPEFINGLTPRYFLTPAQKTFGPAPDPVYDTLTHFVAYEINPKRPITINRDVEDQFGIHPVRIDSSVYLLVPTCKLGARPVDEEACCYTDPTGAPICALVPVGQCAAIGGTVVAACLGDGNGNGVDDACEQPQEEPCCFTGPAGSLICALVPAGQCGPVYGGTVVPACLGDGNGNGVDDACDQPPTTGPNHFKTWRVLQQDPIVARTVSVQDQLMQDNNVRLDSIHYLSNPTRKTVFNPTGNVTFNVLDTTDHLSWYRATGRDTLLGIEFQNQFGRDTVNIDRVKYLLVPTRKFPHQPPNRLDHYKAYRVRSAETLRQPIELEDQFDLQSPQGAERIDSLVERFFLTPAQKQIPGQQPEPVYDTVTHYMAYQIYPTRRMPQIRDIEDQFGVHVIQVDSSELLLVPTKKLKVIFPPPPEEACCYTSPSGVPICGPVPVGECAALGGTVVPVCLGDGNGNGEDDACEQPQPDTGRNHYKTWRVLQQDPLVFRTVFVRDQFKKFIPDTTVRLDSIHYLSNPTRKIVFDPTGSDTFNVVDTTDHLTWYRATGNGLLKGLHVVFQNQFQTDTIRIDRVRYFLLPTRKFPHQPPDRLDHYKAYRIKNPRAFARPIELQDQFDLADPRGPELINSLVPRYFMTPAQKQIPGQQPELVYDTVTHYVAYEINPKRPITMIRDLEDQFGIHVVRVDSSEMLLVPTTKLFVARKLKGDFNGTLDLSPADVVLSLNCTFLGTGDCDLSFGDLDCNGMLSPADVVLELNAVFLDADFPC